MSTHTAPTTYVMTDQDIADFGNELDRIRAEILGSRGEADAKYIRDVITTQRSLEVAGRGALLFSILPPAWIAGTAMLSVSKILENMEIGHNVMHGQWDWMRDPEIHSTTWEWDHVSPSTSWKHTHNVLHHTYTNVVGKDRDVGYTLLRMDDNQRWRLRNLFQPAYNIILAPVFQWGIALYDIEADQLKAGNKTKAKFLTDVKAFARKAAKQVTKDYIVTPLLAGPSAVPAFFGTMAANVVRNIWSNTIIFCGHFPDHVATFTEEEVENETRGGWYVRQLAGSANLEGSPLFHTMTGNLSYQIEHHLFPDLPSNRYGAIAPQVKALCEKYGLHYESGPLSRQYVSMMRRVVRLSLPTARQPVATVAQKAAAKPALAA